MRVEKTTVSSEEIASFIDLELPDSLSVADKIAIKEEAGEFLVDHILLRVGNARNPFTGAPYQGLTKEYRSDKAEDGAGTKANLESSGDMLDALGYSRTDNGVKLFVSGEEALRADGHNNFSGKSQIPTRKFLPEEGDSFPRSVTKEVEAMISERQVASVNIKRSELTSIASKVALNAFIATKFPEVTVAQAKTSILVSKDLRRLFAGLLVLF